MWTRARQSQNCGMARGAVINENDTVPPNEIRYGDDDRLAARVATMASADLLSCCPISTDSMMRRRARTQMQS